MATSSDPRPLPGGPLAIDLLNTKWGRGASEIDWLDEDVAVHTFVETYGHTIAKQRLATIRDSLTEVREVIRRLFSEAAVGEISDGTSNDVNMVLSRSQTRFAASPDGPKMSISSADSEHGLSVEAMVNAISLLEERPDRLRTCKHDDCILWFADTSKAGRRRWCSMELCGNRTKARRHYKRASEHK